LPEAYTANQDCQEKSCALNRLAASFQKARPITTSWSKAGEVWGWVGHPDDLSRYATEDEFFEKLTIAMKTSATPQGRAVIT
jgi:hypothetical protein